MHRPVTFTRTSLTIAAALALLGSATAARAYEEARTGGPPADYVAHLRMTTRAVEQLHAVEAGGTGVALAAAPPAKLDTAPIDRMVRAGEDRAAAAPDPAVSPIRRGDVGY